MLFALYDFQRLEKSKHKKHFYFGSLPGATSLK